MFRDVSSRGMSFRKRTRKSNDLRPAGGVDATAPRESKRGWEYASDFKRFAVSQRAPRARSLLLDQARRRRWVRIMRPAALRERARARWRGAEAAAIVAAPRNASAARRRYARVRLPAEPDRATRAVSPEHTVCT